jgi:hypothetical protein
MFGGMRQSFGTTEVLVRGLTIDMSGGPKPTKQALERPLDGG